MGIRLVRAGDYGEQEIPVEGNDFVIGRELSCQLRLDHGKVSLRHCRIFQRGNRVMVEDLNSTTGTAINDQELGPDPVEVQDGDSLRVGTLNFEIRIGEGEERRTTGAPKKGSDSGISPAVESARQILDKITGHEGSSRARLTARGEPTATLGRSKLIVAERGGVTVARIMARSVVKDNDVRGLADELIDLIERGKLRIALNFGNVENLSSQAIGALLDACRRCQAGGGALKVCNVHPTVAEVFAMTELTRHVEVYPDELPAIESDWPDPARPKLPSAPPVQAPKAASPGGRGSDRPAEQSRAEKKVSLIVEVGRAKGQAIEIPGARFVIGRDPSCQLRPNSETISRVHASVEQREGRIFIKDFGTMNGTILNDRVLRGEEDEVADGDRLQVGVLRFTFSIKDIPRPEAAQGESTALNWLLGEHATDASAATAMFMPTADALGRLASDSRLGPAEDPLKKLRHVGHEVIDGKLVIRVLIHRPDDETTVAPLRHEMHVLLDQIRPTRTVLDLSDVTFLSPRAVGMFLAIFQRIDQSGGSMRVCNASPNIMPVLVQMRLTQLIDVFTTQDEAIKTPWEE